MKKEKQVTESPAESSKFIVTAMTSIYTGITTPDIESFKDRVNEQDELWIIAPEGQFENMLIDSMARRIAKNDSRKIKDVKIKALRHARGQLVGMKKSEDRDNKLQSVCDMLLELDPNTAPNTPPHQ